MNNSASQTTNETRWTRGARLVLAATLLFVALNLAQVAYRFTIPSIGWAGKAKAIIRWATLSCTGSAISTAARRRNCAWWQ